MIYSICMTRLKHLILYGLIALDILVLGWALSNSIPPRIKPIHTSVDPMLKPYVDEYKEMANKKGIHFTREITIGFTDKDQGNTVGVTYYGEGFREIDISSKFWRNTNEIYKKALMFHELSHGYCSRKHDYAKDKIYQEAYIMKITDMFKSKPKLQAAPGYMEDGCPVSLMHPILPEEECLWNYEEYYDNEIFERCIPW